jgi:hypothetical protein
MRKPAASRRRRSHESDPTSPLRVWLDDDLVYREAPEGWVHVQTAWEVNELLGSGRVVELSLDHDLGDDKLYGRGLDVINYLGEQQEVYGRLLWPRDGIRVHSANAYGRDAICRAIRADAGRRLRVIESRTPGNQPRFHFESQEDDQSGA